MESAAEKIIVRPPLVHFDALVAVVALGLSYALVDDQLRLGPRWLLPGILILLLVPIIVTKRSGNHGLSWKIGLVNETIATAAVVFSVGTLAKRVLDGNVTAANLLRDSALLWTANVLVFAMWYWELDGGGPIRRHIYGYYPSDLAFPQTSLGPDFADGWSPDFIDYLFVAFTASSAFSPTDFLVLSRRTKGLMMIQSLVSIVTLAVLAARAVNTLR